ncbi:uncharacterized protein TRIADDRAFT_56978 [Trichoplax adhaerens]|uniref:Cytochrome P450 n=1 Tax=Trichoplax adhaerens TaxID=10228 RepID=B3RX33_TRIAD|nr:hypothetical protein TRIADDRAFT_56978 [Trichoplax adhaerens]EDV25236.1 hypothetical protein TRIADDRAFT_56978 [Trichoplax adhaerens]|eukprot:XP_002113126.1 hypothetical protein TRIADDRAFT_56978 [Trichoplax adhaerens]
MACNHSRHASIANQSSLIARATLRFVATTANQIDDQNNKNVNAKPLTDMPGPKGLPFIGNLWTILKNNRYYQNRSHELLSIYHAKYGPIYKCRLGSIAFVYITKPEDIAKVFKVEGKYPNRGPILPFLIYREQRKKPKGILVGISEDWRLSRSIMDKKLLKLKDVKAYDNRLNEVTTDFIHYIKRRRIEDNLNGEIINLKECLYKWSFESINTVIYNKRLGALNDPPIPLAKKFYTAVFEMLDRTGLLRLVPPYYKYIQTKYWKEYCGFWDTLFEIGEELIVEERARLQKLADSDHAGQIPQDSHRSENMEFLPYVLSRGELTDEQITANIIELMAGGVDTSANTITSALYILGKNPDIQENLYQEVKSVIKDRECLDWDSLQKMSYLRGVLKESQRIYPVVQGLSRIIAKDVVLSGYHVPAKTMIITGSYAMAFDKSLYDEPDKVKPERWIRSSEQKQPPFSFLPFGFGTRMCIGRRIAELEMQILLARLVYEFRLDTLNTEKIKLINRIVLSPEQAIRIAFHPRNS